MSARAPRRARVSRRRHPVLGVGDWMGVATLGMVVKTAARHLAIYVSPSFGKEWIATAIEIPPTPLEGEMVALVQDALDDHAHKVIGRYGHLSDAITASESFAVCWLKEHKSTRAAACACSEIEA